MPEECLVNVAMTIFRHHGVLNKFSIGEDIFRNWVVEVSKSYLPNPYHNAIHAAVNLPSALFCNSFRMFCKQCM